MYIVPNTTIGPLSFLRGFSTMGKREGMRMAGIKIITRKRIDQKLTNVFAYPLTIVHAPMGYGKTTAVAEFLKTRDVHMAWVPMSVLGDSVDAMWTRLSEELERQGMPLGARLHKLGFPYDDLKASKVLDLLIDYEYEKPAVLVLDDFQLVTERRAFSLIRQIAEARIAHLHFVIVTRELARLGAAGLYQKQLCFTLTEKSLKFTREEIGQYFEMMDCSIDEDQLDKVAAYTDGWISMVYIFLKGLQRGLPIGRNSTIDDIIEQNLYQDLEEEQKTALLTISFLGAFTLPMAVYVLNRDDGAQVLEALVRKNTFLVYDELNNSYRIRNLLLEYLVEKARFQNIDFRELYKRAGEWYLREKRYMNAFEFLNKAGEADIILGELNRENTPDIHFRQFDQINRIFDGLDEAYCLKYPLAFLQYFRIVALSEEPASLRRAREGLRRIEAYVHNAAIDEEYRRFLLGEIHVVWSFVVFNDLEQMIAHNTKAAEYFSGGCSCIVTRKKEFTFGSPHLLYCYYREEGGLRTAMECLTQNAPVLTGSIDGCGTGCDSVALAEYALETGDFEQVELHAYKALYKAKSAGQTCLMICAKFVLARLSIYQGNHDEGATILESLRKEVLAENNPVLNTTFDLVLAYVELCLGKLDTVPAWIRDGDESAASFMKQGKSFYDLVHGKAVLLAGDLIRLDALCETFPDRVRRYHNQWGIVVNQIYAAIAAAQLRGRAAGICELEKALRMGQQDELVMPFAENAGQLLEMLKMLDRQYTGDRAYFSRVLSCCLSYHARLDQLHGQQMLLTRRETEILTLLEQGFKHEEIGKRLFISVTTVRYHIKNVYQKLEVNNKVLAIRKARDEGLI